jgi:hypothetical protein
LRTDRTGCGLLDIAVLLPMLSAFAQGKDGA